MRILIYSVFVLLIFGCKKSQKSLTAEEQLTKKRTEDALFNSTIVPGIGNVFYEEKLVPNTESQLIFKIAVNGDTLAGYGKINSSGQLDYISSTILAKKGNAELLVTELFPEVSKSRMYSMTNNRKSNIVIDIDHISKTKFVVSILDLDWTTGVSELLKTTYINNGIKSSEFISFRGGEDRVYNCIEPQPSDDFEKEIDNWLDYFACGFAWDAHLLLTPIKDAVVTGIEGLKSLDKYKDQINELELFKTTYNKLTDLYNSITGKMQGFKYEKEELKGLLKTLQELLNKLKTEKVEVLLVPFTAGTDVDYDEVTDSEIKLSFIITDKNSGLPYTKKPVFIDMAWLSSASEVVFLETKPSSTVNGLVTFRFDPTTIPNYQIYTNLTALYSFTQDDFTPSASQPVTLKFIVPKVVFSNGSPIPGSVRFVNNQSQSFKLVNQDDRILVVDYDNVTLNNSNNKVGYTMFRGTNSFSVSLTTEETAEQVTQLDVIYKQKKISTINATILKNDSLDFYKNFLKGEWFWENYMNDGMGGIIKGETVGRSNWKTTFNPDGTYNLRPASEPSSSGTTYTYGMTKRDVGYEITTSWLGCSYSFVLIYPNTMYRVGGCGAYAYWDITKQ